MDGISYKDYFRYDLLNEIISQIKATSYLEIGVCSGENFHKVKCSSKVGVDPAPKSQATVEKTSDEFFFNNDLLFDVVFIDGLHLSHQVLKDVINSARCLKSNGVIVLHDCLPQMEIHQGQTYRAGHAWTGDVWKAYFTLRVSGVQSCIVDIDWGCGVLTNLSSKMDIAPIPSLTWRQYVSLKSSVFNPLNIVSLNQYLGTV